VTIAAPSLYGGRIVVDWLVLTGGAVLTDPAGEPRRFVSWKGAMAAQGKLAKRA
jgi:hypothetical protein